MTARSSNPIAGRIISSIGKVVIGKAAAIELLLVALICDGHVLLEDVPGVGKTLLAKSLARSLRLGFKRIQFTPDLLPADITGTQILDQKSREFVFRYGPLFTNVVLADEINRATPRTQSALLEAMEEGQVTADGVTMPLPRPFLVLATQNPVELEGTFPLPEAQLDRFFLRLQLGYPSADEEEAILLRVADTNRLKELDAAIGVEELQKLKSDAARVYVSDAVRAYIVALVHATRGRSDLVLGASPRATLALFRGARAVACLQGWPYVRPDDVKAIAPAVLSHRIILSTDARLSGLDATSLITQILASVPVPAEDDVDAGSLAVRPAPG
jgi:MoxR-like ATPase